MRRRKREPCPAGIEDSCPVPRYRCREVGQPGRHCFELFAEFELFVLPDAEDSSREAQAGDDEATMPHEVDDDVTAAVLRRFQSGNRPRGGIRWV